MAQNIDEILSDFERTTEQFLSKDEFKAKLRSGKKLRVKYTIDTKTPTLHIGHAVNLWLLRKLQDLGHKVVFVFADFNSRIGDTDGRLDTIRDMPQKDIEANIRDVLKQAKMILRFDEPELIEVRRNSEWYGTMSIKSFLDLLSVITHARAISRDQFQMQIEEGSEIHLNEMLYPVMQAYDSYIVESDLCIAGSDQLFQESLGRLIQEKHKKKPQTLITTTMTPGIDGRNKQSQKRDNDIALTHTPRDKFGRVMSIPDTLIEDYLRVYTDIPLKEIADMKEMIQQRPKAAKIALAVAIVEKYHGRKKAEEERDWFDNTISKGYMPPDIPVLTLAHHYIDAIDLIVLARPDKSKSDSRRLILQGGIELNGRKLRNPDQELYLKDNDVLKIGKRTWFHIRIIELPVLDTEQLMMKPIEVADIDFMTAYIPEYDWVKYLGQLGAHEHEDEKKKQSQKLDDLKKAVYQPDDNNTWLWKISPKNEPDKVIGIAQIRGNAVTEGHNFWLAPGFNANLLQEAMLELTEQAFLRMDARSAAFKNAFAYATSYRDPETLYEAVRRMNPEFLNKSDASLAIHGFTVDGWDRMQEWRRVSAPWLFKDMQEKTLENKLQQQKKMRLKDEPKPEGF